MQSNQLKTATLYNKVRMALVKHWGHLFQLSQSKEDFFLCIQPTQQNLDLDWNHNFFNLTKNTDLIKYIGCTEISQKCTETSFNISF